MKYIENMKGYSELSTWEQEHVKKTYKAIKKGRIYASIESVSRTGMSRRIKFYRVEKNRIIQATNAVNYLRHQKWDYMVNDAGMKVTGCGMDMIFHTLYSALQYKDAKNWKQNYSTL